MSVLRMSIGVLSATFAVGLAACSDEQIVLATVPSLATDAPGELTRCANETDCSVKTFCAREQCGDVGGVCQPRPIVCEDEAVPVCGCDGITYWNDCLRRAAGIGSMTLGECIEHPRPCGGDPGPLPPPQGPDHSDGCPAGAFCARLLPPSPEPEKLCPLDVPGTCWALPAVCPIETHADRWLACGPSEGACKTTCEAIRTGEPHRRARACP